MKWCDAVTRIDDLWLSSLEYRMRLMFSRKASYLFARESHSGQVLDVGPSYTLCVVAIDRVPTAAALDHGTFPA